MDGLKGFPEAIEAVHPQTQVQLCMVHLVRHSLLYVSHKDRKAMATDLKEIYQAATLEEASSSLSILGCLGERQELQYGLSDRAALFLHT